MEMLIKRPAARLSSGMTFLLAGAVAVIVFTLFASQALVGLIGPSLGLGAGSAALVPTVTMLGYAAGLVLLVPLSDLVDNRRLIVATLGAGVAALIAAALVAAPAAFIAAAFAVGMT